MYQMKKTTRIAGKLLFMRVSCTVYFVRYSSCIRLLSDVFRRIEFVSEPPNNLKRAFAS